MFDPKQSLFLFLASVFVLSFVSTDAFVLRPSLTTRAKTVSYSNPRYLLRMATEESETENEEVTAESETQEEAEEEEEEDPELKALKEEISKLEAELKEKRRQVMYTSDQADDYTKSGYALKVAEMENMRRARSMLNSSNKSACTAAVLTKFLPVLDQLTELREAYSEDEFGKQYGALTSDLKGAFSKLGVTEYTIATGDPVDKSRVAVIESEYSTEHEADTVIRPVALGLELQGNIVRMAKCVASLGPEPVEEEKVPEEPCE